MRSLLEFLLGRERGVCCEEAWKALRLLECERDAYRRQRDEARAESERVKDAAVWFMFSDCVDGIDHGDES